MRQAVIFKGKDGQWVAECLSVPGCVSQGQIREAIQLYITVLEEDHLPIPEEQFDTLLVAA
jgi:predicted RNase H-like HicB family nuclease